MTPELMAIWFLSTSLAFIGGWHVCDRWTKRHVDIHIVGHIDTERNRMEIINATWKTTTKAWP